MEELEMRGEEHKPGLGDVDEEPEGPISLPVSAYRPPPRWLLDLMRGPMRRSVLTEER